ncbi:MAG: TrmB family transcriptional regulator [Thermoplasmata archaeon]
MLVHQERLDVLHSLGLTMYEARAYLVLLEAHEAKASKVARAAKVPRGRIYDVLDRLHGRGLVEIVPATPRRYRAVSLGSFLKGRKEALLAQAEEMERNVEPLATLFTPQARESPESVGEFLVYRKRRAVLGKMRAMIKSASEEVLILCSESCAVRSRKAFLDAYRERAQAGVDLRMSCSVTEANVEAIKALETVLRVRHRDVGNQVVSILVVDGVQALFSHWDPDDEELFRGEDIAIWTDDAGVVNSLRSMVDDAWEQGQETSLRYYEIETGKPVEQTEVIIDPERARSAVRVAVSSVREETWASTLNSMVEAQHESFLPLLERFGQEGIRRRMLVAYDGGSLHWAPPFVRLGVDIRLSESQLLGRYLGVDQSQVLAFVGTGAAEALGGSSGLRGGKAEILLVRTVDRGAVRVFRAAFEQAWEQATPLEQFATPEARKSGSRRASVESG